MKLILATLITPLLLLLTACGHRPPTASGATPEEAAVHVVQKIGYESADIQLHGSRVTPYGTAVLYTAGHARAAEDSAMGFVLTQQRGSSWVTRDVMHHLLHGWIRNTHYVDVTGRVHDLAGQRVGSTFGLVLDPQVTAVQVTFDNGQVLRDTVTSEGMFVLLTDDSAGYCEVKALDAQGQVLETIRAEDQSGC
jgi:hypothetical protein